VLEAAADAWQWPTAPHDTGLAPDERVMKVLSEHTCRAWLQGYYLTAAREGSSGSRSSHTGDDQDD